MKSTNNHFYYFILQNDINSYGLSNLFEYQHNLYITQADTDHDGIADGEEYHYWQNRLKESYPNWDDNTINTTAISYCLNPDVDNDSIPDGKEIRGYRVKIITGWKSEALQYLVCVLSLRAS